MPPEWIADIVFTILVVLVMSSMKRPKKGTLKSVFHNITFWLYAAFWMKTVATVVRLPLVFTNTMSQTYIMIFFNWSGSFIATLSTVIPCGFVLHHLRHGSLSQMSMKQRLLGCLLVVVVYIILLIICIIVIETHTASAKEVLFVWRVFFFANAGLESLMIFWSLLLIRKITKDSSKSRNTSRHLLITLYMRGGIAMTIIFKLMKLFNFEVLAILHLFFVFTGLFAYHLRVLATAKKLHFSISTVFRRTDQALVVEAPAVPSNQMLALFPVAIFGKGQSLGSPPTIPTLGTVDETANES